MPKSLNAIKKMPRKIWRAVAAVIEHYHIRRIDRYIISKFLSTYIFLIAIIVVIAIIFDYNEKIDKFASSNATWQQVEFDYYLNFVPYFVNLFSPLFVFIAENY